MIKKAIAADDGRLDGIVVNHDAPLIDAINVIDKSGLQIALAVDEERKLVGILTDGDVRRALLGGAVLESPITPFVNRNYKFGFAGEERDRLFARMKLNKIRQIPILDDTGKLIGLVTFDDLLTPEKMPNLVVLLAGGQGKRLRPLTESCPKPLLKVGGRPLLETMISNLKEQGFENMVISLNYLGEQIRDHFGDGSAFGVDISYVVEDMPLGTGGPLSLLSERPREPIIVMNGDLLTKVNFKKLLEFHESSGTVVTVCAREHKTVVPYGVIEVDGDRLETLVEKPTQSCLVSAGIYVLDPAVIDIIPKNTFIDMPDIMNIVLREGQRPAVFPLYEYWLDIGQPEDYKRALDEFALLFE